MRGRQVRGHRLTDLEAHVQQLQQLQRQLVSTQEFVTAENMQLKQMLKQMSRLPVMRAIGPKNGDATASWFRPVARVSVWTNRAKTQKAVIKVADGDDVEAAVNRFCKEHRLGAAQAAKIRHDLERGFAQLRGAASTAADAVEKMQLASDEPPSTPTRAAPSPPCPISAPSALLFSPTPWQPGESTWEANFGEASSKASFGEASFGAFDMSFDSAFGSNALAAPSQPSPPPFLPPPPPPPLPPPPPPPAPSAELGPSLATQWSHETTWQTFSRDEDWAAGAGEEADWVDGPEGGHSLGEALEAALAEAHAARAEAHQARTDAREVADAFETRVAALEGQRDRYRHIARELKKRRDEEDAQRARGSERTGQTGGLSVEELLRQLEDALKEKERFRSIARECKRQRDEARKALAAVPSTEAAVPSSTRGWAAAAPLIERPGHAPPHPGGARTHSNEDECGALEAAPVGPGSSTQPSPELSETIGETMGETMGDEMCDAIGQFTTYDEYEEHVSSAWSPRGGAPSSGAPLSRDGSSPDADEGFDGDQSPAAGSPSTSHAENRGAVANDSEDEAEAETPQAIAKQAIQQAIGKAIQKAIRQVSDEA